MLSDRDLDRYSRQLMLPEFSIDQQERLAASAVLIVGCGGLGSPLALYLAAAGIGHLILVDDDRVEESNLQRQILFGAAQLGDSKAVAAQALLQARYPHCRLSRIDTRLAGSALDAAVASADLVADGSDNFPTRFALNRACLAHAKPLVSAAAVRGEGQLATFHGAPDGPCYRCLYPREGDETALSCRDSGVIGPVVGAVGTLQALEVIKVLTGWGTTLQGHLLLLDLMHYQQHRVVISRRVDCPDCGASG